MKSPIFFLFILITLNSFSQDKFTRKKYIGLELGPTFSDLISNNNQLNSNLTITGKFGLVGEVCVEQGFRPRFSFKYGFLISPKHISHLSI